jgi:two-component system chemotaxis response regulator CheB
MSEVKLVRQRRPPGAPAAPSAPLPRPTIAPGPFRLLGLVASTGGPQALLTLLGGLPTDFPLPILIVQHIGETFLQGFAAWLQDNGPLPVAVARDGEVPAAGRVYLAPAQHHLELRAGRLCWAPGSLVSGQRPSGTVLFRSLARELGPRAIGVLLTGMGDDGATGLLEMRQAGAHTIAEHESTTVVNGMPGSACRLGAARETLPLPAIAPHLLDLLRAPEPGAVVASSARR